MDRIHGRQASIRSRSLKVYDRPLRILRGNPSAQAKEFAEAMEALRKLGDMKKH